MNGNNAERASYNINVLITRTRVRVCVCVLLLPPPHKAALLSGFLYFLSEAVIATSMETDKRMP